jgi:CDP-diacylglycerol--serine O-phosphatidyltransferase
LSLLLAIIAMVLLFEGEFYCSFAVALLAFFTDILDGAIARKFGVETKFGRMFDSFVDIFIYLLYPALVFFYYFGLSDLLSIIVILIFLTAGIYRLVRFTKRGFTNKRDKLRYSGLPVVFSHSLILIFLLFEILRLPFFVIIANISIFALSFLMVQHFYFPKPKKVGFLIFSILFISLILFSICYYGTA